MAEILIGHAIESALEGDGVACEVEVAGVGIEGSHSHHGWVHHGLHLHELHVGIRCGSVHVYL